MCNVQGTLSLENTDFVTTNSTIKLIQFCFLAIKRYKIHMAIVHLVKKLTGESFEMFYSLILISVVYN